MEQLGMLLEAGITSHLSFAERWNLRSDRIRKSKKAGNVHLDQVRITVQVLRGRKIYNVHDPLEWGLVNTVSIRNDVIVRWPDQYSASKNYIGSYDVKPSRMKKVTIKGSWLASEDLGIVYFVDPMPYLVLRSVRVINSVGVNNISR